MNAEGAGRGKWRGWFVTGTDTGIGKAAAIQADGVRPVGWVADQIEPELALFEENIATLRFKVRLDVPPLGIFPHQETGFNPIPASKFILDKVDISHF